MGVTEVTEAMEVTGVTDMEDMGVTGAAMEDFMEKEMLNLSLKLKLMLNPTMAMEDTMVEDMAVDMATLEVRKCSI